MKKQFYKIIAFALCIMLFACPVSAYENKVVQAENPQSAYDENIETISALGILDWDTDTFSASENVTRGEFTRLITNIVSNGVYSTDSVMSVFADVSADSELGKILYTAKSFGIVSGDGEGSFYPDRPVTYEEAYKILGSALGYDADAKANGGYPTGYVMSCIKAGLKSDSIEPLSDKLTPSGAAKLIVDAFECNVMKVKLVNNNTEYEIDRDEDWIYTAKKILISEGVVTANSITALQSFDTIDQGFVSIDDVRYKCDENFDLYLGYNVKFYYTEENGNCDRVLHMTKQYNDELLIDANDIADGVLSSDRKIEYYTANDDTKKVKIPVNASIIYNGRAINTYGENIFNISYGFIKLTDNNSDGIYDVVFLSEYKNMIIGAVNTVDKSAADKYNGNVINFMPYEKEKIIRIYDETGKETDFSKLTAGDVLSYAESEDGKILTIYVSKKKIEGKIESVSEVRSKKYYGIKGSETALAADASFDTSSVKLNAVGIAYLNAFGEITDFVSGNEIDNLVCVIDAYIDKDRAANALNIKVMDKNGDVKTLESLKSVMLNGTRVKNIIENDTVPAVITAAKSGLALIELDEKGLVKKIETPDAVGSKLHTFGAEADLCYYSANKTFGGIWFADPNAVIYVAPKEAERADDAEVYRITTMNEFWSNVTYRVTGYTVGDGSHYAKAILFKEDNDLKITGNEAHVIKAITKTVNAKGDTVNVLETASYVGGLRKYETKDETILADAKVGDIVLIHIVNSVIDKGEIVLYAKDLSFNPDSEFVKKHSTLTYAAGSNYKYGNVLFRNNTLILLVDDDGLEKEIAKGKNISDYKYSDFSEIGYTDLTSATVYAVDRTVHDKNDMVYRADTNAIKDYLTFGEASKIFIYTRTGYPRLAVVYK